MKYFFSCFLIESFNLWEVSQKFFFKNEVNKNDLHKLLNHQLLILNPKGRKIKLRTLFFYVNKIFKLIFKNKNIYK